MLLEKYKNYSNAYNKIRRDCNNGKLVKLIRGLYEDNPSVSPFLCSGYIYGPSYISFDYVLSRNGLIPEYVPTVTCATFNKNKSKEYNTPIGTFIYKEVPKEAFPLGTIPKLEDNYSYIIATNEKALCDKLYTITQVGSLSSFEDLLFEDLRIDVELLKTLDWELIRMLATHYKRSNLNFLLKYYEKRISI